MTDQQRFGSGGEPYPHVEILEERPTIATAVLTTLPELRSTATGRDVVQLVVDVTRWDVLGIEGPGPDDVACLAWDDLAVDIAGHATVGSILVLTGRLARVVSGDDGPTTVVDTLVLDRVGAHPR